LHRLVRRTIEVKQWLVERSAMTKGKICLNEGEMLDPENPRQGGDHLSRFMTEKMFHHWEDFSRWWSILRGCIANG